MLGSVAVMSEYSDTFDHAMANKLLDLLGALRNSESGSALYRHIEDMLNELISHHQESEDVRLGVIDTMLESLGRQLPEGASLQVELQLLRSRLKPPVTDADMDALRKYLDLYSAHLQFSKEQNAVSIADAVQPLLSALTSRHAQVDQKKVVPEIEEQAVPVATNIRTASVTAMGSHVTLRAPLATTPEKSTVVEAAATIKPEAGAQDSPAPVPTPSAPKEDEPKAQPVDVTSGNRVSAGHHGLQDMPTDLAQQVMETIAQNEEFGVLLELVETELRQASGVDDLESLRWTMIRQIEKLSGEHHTLASKLDGTHQYLKLIESDSRQLSDELHRVRLLSLTDELTGLPNRRAFLRRLEDEVARVQRYGFPLSMALIDLDKFKEINDQFGHAGGDEVLRIYSKNILSIFRHHDLVARYGGEEFAVLLANTSTDGSARALEKVKKRALETRWQCNHRTLPVPTFSAGLALYKPGETSSAFIERVDQALYRAKRLGRDRIELDDTYPQESDPVENRPRPDKQSPGRE